MDKPGNITKKNDTWSNTTANPFKKDNYNVHAIGFSFKGTGYVLQSGQYLYKYDILSDIWVKTSEYPGCRGDNSYKTIFVIGDKAFFAATFSNYTCGSPLMYSYKE